jgi:hypothetical protein
MNAFPYAYFDKQLNQTRVMSGMTLRDYFAAKAMQGMMADGQAFRLVAESTLANTAYEIADAMLKARQE